MSSILKALRRLEEERARKSHVAPEIAASLLRTNARHRPPPPWIWPAATIVVAAMATAVFWSWRPAPVASPIVTSIAAPVTISRAVTAGRGGEVIIEEVMDQRRPVLLPPVPPTLPQAQSKPPSATVKSKILTPTAADNPAPAFIAERQTPVVSAIVWQEDSSARMAVVDGLPVMTGEFVGTAKVQEILRDRILFTERGKLFTVYVDPP